MKQADSFPSEAVRAPRRDGWGDGGGRTRSSGGRAHARRQAGRLARAQQSFLPLLACATLVTMLAVVGAAYAAFRSSATAGLQAQVARDARTARQLVVGMAGAPGQRDGRLVLGGGQEGSAAAALARVRGLTGERVALYGLSGGRLVAVAADGLGGIGDAAPRPAADALAGAGGPLAPPACHRAYAGTVTLRDGDYAAAFVPLFDANGAFVGALGVGQPRAIALAPAAQIGVVLLLAGLLVSLAVLVAGAWLFGLATGRMLDALSVRLAHLGAVAGELERVAAAQVVATRRQERLARQIGEGARDLDALVGTLQQGRLSLHDSASGMWAEMSQPGAAPDPASAMRLARQAVVLAARIGVATEEARVRCTGIVRLMNQVIAEGHALTGRGCEAERRAAELRAAVERLGLTLGEPLPRPRPPIAHPIAGAHRPLGNVAGRPASPFARPRDGVRAHGRRLVARARSLAGVVSAYVVERASELAGRAADFGDDTEPAGMRPPRRPPPESDPWATNPRLARPDVSRLPRPTDPSRRADAGEDGAGDEG